MIPCFVVDGELDLVGLVHVDHVHFIGPSVISSRFGASLEAVFHLDVDGRLRSSRESSRRGMIDIRHGVDTDGELTGQRLAHVG